MKKLLLILTVVFVSVTSVFAGLNPYAYDLKSEWFPQTQILRVHFTLNDHPNTDQKIVNGKPTNETGIQIFALDRNNKSKLYCIYMVPAADIIAHINANNFQYDIDIPINGRDLATGEALPTGKNLTFAVRVQGLNKTNKSTPSAPIYADDNNRPFSCHGVAVNNNQDSPDFGAIYVTEAANDNELSGTRDWLIGKGKAILQYTPKMRFEASYRKSSAFSDRKKTLLEPHRVCVSDDGRIFVSSYNYVTNNDIPVVWEMLKNANGTATYNPVIYHNEGYPGAYGHRVCGMDVKGSGNNIKIILCYIAESTNDGEWANSFRIYEYSLNSLGANKNNGTLKYRHKPNGYTSDGSTASEQGAMHYAIRKGKKYVTAGDVTSDDPYFYTDGFANVSYAGANKNDIILSIDYYIGQSFSSRLLYLEGGTTLKSTQAINNADHYYGGAGIHSYMDGSNQYIVSGRAKYHGFGDQPKNQESDGRIHTYNVNSGTISSTPKDNWTLSGAKIRCIVNDMSMDCANNIYAISFTDGTTNIGTGRLLAFAMPYSGTTLTIAPNIGTSQTFSLAPVPNILATDLCVTPHDKQAKYIFSFNVNTKPEGAEIRFYTSEQDMLNDSKQNATYSDYDNHDNCAFYYRFSSTELKQGRMFVELDILGHEGEEELTDKKLPSGKLYWNVFLKTRRSLAFSPIYVQPLEDASGTRTHYRVLATIDNNPDNDGFGHIYAIDYKRTKGNPSDTQEDGMDTNPCKLMRYTIGDADIDDNSGAIESDERYALIDSLSTDEMVQPRRPSVAPDGMVYLTDYGDYDNRNQSFEDGPKSLVDGGIWLFDPNDPYKSTTEAKLGRFYDASETTSGVSFYDDGTNIKLYKTNTYEEYSHYGQNDFTNTKWQNNGYRVYTVGTSGGDITHRKELGEGQVVPLGQGDSYGDISVKATNDGVWLCQSRKTADRTDFGANFVQLMFYNHNGARKFDSHVTQPQYLDYTPGGGMTISKDEQYLYVVNHEADIIEYKIGGTAETGKTLTYNNKFNNNADYNSISSMNFDYAGNLVITRDEDYPAYIDQSTQIVVFTMPYNRDNARSIPASKAQREIPERLSYAEDQENTLATIAKTPTLVDLFRPMPNTSYSTICLPFALDISTLEDGHPYKTADIRAFEGAELSDAVGGEKILYLNFSADPVTLLSANTPYIIKPSVRVPGIVELPATTWGEYTANTTTQPKSFDNNNNSITFTGVIPKQDIVVEPGKTLILVAENRLAEMEPDDNATNKGEILGFRGYFTLGEPLPQGVQAIIRNKDNTVTGLVDINGKKVNINKYLREGRVYIRVGDTLYTVGGQKIGR